MPGALEELDELLAAVMVLSRGEVTAATESLRTVFHQSNAQVHALTQLEQELTDATSSSLAGQLDQQATAIRTLASGVDEVSTAQQSRVSEIEEVVGSLRSVGQFMDKLNFASKLLALNVAVEASRLGATAGAIGTVADEMQRHSARTSKVTDQILELADRLMRLLGEIHGQSSTLADLSRSEGDRALRALGSVEEALARTQEHATESVNTAREEANALTNSAHEALQRLQFEDRSQQMLDRARALLAGRDAIADHTRRSIQLTDPPTYGVPDADGDGQAGEVDFF